MPYRTKEEHNAWRRRVYKQRREEFFADKCCVDCGSGIFLEIDHVDPKTKVTHRIWLQAKEKRERELQKCVVRCSSCHKNRHKKDGGKWRKKKKKKKEQGSETGYKRLAGGSSGQ